MASRARLESARPRVLDEACALGASRLDERLRGGARCAVRLELALQPVHRRERAATRGRRGIRPFTGRPRSGFSAASRSPCASQPHPILELALLEHHRDGVALTLEAWHDDVIEGVHPARRAGDLSASRRRLSSAAATSSRRSSCVSKELATRSARTVVATRL